MKVALIPTAASEWDAAGRLLGRVELSLSAAGEAECGAWAEQLAPLGLARLLHARDTLSTQTAERIGRRMGIGTKGLRALAEVDLGLWSGLTDAELGTRFASAHRELEEAPQNVVPPGGEALRAAAQRLHACALRQLRRHAAPLGFVLRPLAWSLLVCQLGHAEARSVWSRALTRRGPTVIELDADAAMRGT